MKIRLSLRLVPLHVALLALGLPALTTAELRLIANPSPAHVLSGIVSADGGTVRATHPIKESRLVLDGGSAQFTGGEGGDRQAGADAFPHLPTDAPVLVGAGDIATCGDPGAEETAKLLDQIAGIVFTSGDNAYEEGNKQEYFSCYEPTWGRHKERTRPAPGNHEYKTSAAHPYFEYFGENAGPAGRGYYSYDVGSWHIVSLNSNISARAGSAQVRWLREDLATHPAKCTLAYWHHPVFSSGKHGNDARMREVWRVLYEFGADVVVNGHDHIYERFAPQTPAGVLDEGKGIREFIVGTGGKSLYRFGTIRANSQVRANSAFGVLKLTLYPTRYAWEFIPVAGHTFRDSGSDECVF